MILPFPIISAGGWLGLHCDVRPATSSVGEGERGSDVPEEEDREMYRRQAGGGRA